MVDDDDAINKRAHERKTVLAEAELLFGDRVLDCSVMDISPGGAKVQVGGVLKAKSEVILKVDPYGEFPAEIAWRHNLYYGLKFLGNQDEIAESLMALAIYG